LSNCFYSAGVSTPVREDDVCDDDNLSMPVRLLAQLCDCCSGWQTRHLAPTPMQRRATSEHWSLTQATTCTVRTFVSVSS